MNYFFYEIFYLFIDNYIFIYNYQYNFRALYRFTKVKLFINSAKKNDQCVAEMFEKNVAAFPDKVAFIFEGKKWTFKMMSVYSNQIAHMLLKRGKF